MRSKILLCASRRAFSFVQAFSLPQQQLPATNHEEIVTELDEI